MWYAPRMVHNAHDARLVTQLDDHWHQLVTLEARAQELDYPEAKKKIALARKLLDEAMQTILG